MAESGLIRTETIRNATYYHMTENGAQTLEFFEKEISPEIRRDITNYLVTHSYEMRSEASTLADYYRTSNQDFAVHCMVKGGKNHPDRAYLHGTHGGSRTDPVRELEKEKARRRMRRL